MIIDSITSTKVSDEKGNLTPLWQKQLQQLVTGLQKNYSNEGTTIPQQPAKVIQDSLNSAKSIGNLVYDKDTKALLINIDGKFEQIVTKPYP